MTCDVARFGSNGVEAGGMNTGWGQEGGMGVGDPGGTQGAGNLLREEGEETAGSAIPKVA